MADAPRRALATSLVHRGEAVQGQDPRAAASMFAEAALAAAAQGDFSLAAGASQREAEAWATAGQPDRTRAAADLALAHLQRVTDEQLRVNITTNVAVALGTAGYDHQAVGMLVAALSRLTAGRGFHPSTLPAVLLNLAVSETKMGRHADALKHLAEAEELVDVAKDPGRVGAIRLNQAVAHSALHDPRSARASYTQAIELYVESGATAQDLGHALRGQAVTLARLGRYEDALLIYEQAIDLFEQAEASTEVFRTRVGELMCRHSLGRPISASELGALESQMRDKPLDVVGQMSRNIGVIRLSMGDYALAEKSLMRARRSFGRLNSPGDVASIDGNRALVAKAQGDLARARRLMGRARAQQVRRGDWLAVAHQDVNLASMCALLADETEPANVKLLRRGLDHIDAGLDAIDLYRHQLGTPIDRSAVMSHVYGGAFRSGIRLALRCGDLNRVAAYVEQARVQPVLADPSASDRPYRAPLRVVATRRDARARPGEIGVISEEAARITGSADARWLGWWLNEAVVVSCVTHARGSGVTVNVRDAELSALADTLPIPLASELAVAPSDSAAQLSALHRALSGPLVGDDRAARAIERALPEQLRRLNEMSGRTRASGDDAALLWPLTRLLIPEPLRAELLEAWGRSNRMPLVLAPPPELGRVPWAALPLADPRVDPTGPRLVEAADITIALPLSLSRWQESRPASQRGELSDGPRRPVVIADPRGDLRHLRSLTLTGAQRFGANGEPATRAAVLAAAAQAPMLVVGAHVGPGTSDDPASSAMLLGSAAEPEVLTAADLAREQAPPVCVLFTCDGAGAATGTEWTGVATGLIWAGADWVVTTTCPTVDDRVARRRDQELLDSVAAHGPQEGLWSWQRSLAAARRESATAANAPLRWATTIVTGSGGQVS